MITLNEHQIVLLRELIKWDGAATSEELGGYSPFGARARQRSKLQGLVTYDGGSQGYWRITNAGRAALSAANQQEKP